MMAAYETGIKATAASSAVRLRLPFIDNIRWSMIILVLSMHASDTYSPFGNWYYTDRGPLAPSELIFFITYQSFLQAFFMALLFFVAAYFTPTSYDRKGALPFIRDRFRRLMLPTILYVFVIGPLTEYFVSHTWTGGGGFPHQWLEHVTDGEWLSGTGPMWFCAALFCFSLIYAAAREIYKFFSSAVIHPALPRLPSIAAFIVLMAIGTFLTRIAIPESASVLNVHPGDFPQYILMFTAGILAARGAWFEKLSNRLAIATAVTTLGLAVVLWIGLMAWAIVSHGDLAEFGGGWTLPSAGKSLWEALVCVGVSFALVGIYRANFNSQGPVSRLLSDNAFAVYLFHPPVIIAIAMLIHPVLAPGILKAAILTLLATIAMFALSQLVFRRIPYLKSIL